MSDENISTTTRESHVSRQSIDLSQDKLPTETGAMRRVLFLDVLRAIACLMVVFYHSAVNIGVFPYVIWGFCGVHLFFVLSGYLLAVPYCKALLAGTPLPDVRTFYLRRFIRVLPPYFVALALFVAIRNISHLNVPSVKNIVSHLFLVFNYGSDVEFFSINPVFWTLAIELQFYLFLPLFMASLSWFVNMSKTRRTTTVLGGLILLLLVGIVSRTVEFYWHSGNLSGGNDAIKFKSFLSYLDLFAAGMLVAFFKHLPEGHFLRRFAPLRMVGCGIVLIVAANLWLTMRGHYDWLTVSEVSTAVFFPVLVATGFAFILLSHVLAPEQTTRFLHIPVLAWVGRISYSVYLYHVGLQVVLWQIFGWQRYITSFPILALVNALTTLPIVLLISYGLYRMVEEPSLNWMNALQKRKPPAKGVSA
ncbi:MAG: acyltransferase [Fibrella sp.]|nr:acyltransferase [Armatimonadota bacterium]